jgi:hypothetical protein
VHFAWNFTPATGINSLNTAIIRIVISRYARVEIPYRLLQILQSRGENLPIIEVYRVHDFSLIPSLGSAINLSRLIKPEVSFIDQYNLEQIPVSSDFNAASSNTTFSFLNPASLNTFSASNRRHDVKIRTLPLKTTFNYDNQIDERWSLELSSHESFAAGFAYQLVHPPQSQAAFYEIHVCRTRAVTVRLNISWDDRAGAARVIYKEHIVRHLHQVPAQGADLSNLAMSIPDASSPRYHFRRQLSARVRMQFNVFEMMIGIVPIVGDIYGAVQTIYASVTGENFFGDPVSETELALMYVGCLASLISVDAGVLNSLKAIFRRFRRLNNVADSLGTNELKILVTESLDDEVIAAAVEAEPEIQRRIRTLLSALDADAIELSTSQILAEIQSIVRRLNTEVTPDLLTTKLSGISSATELRQVMDEALLGLEPPNTTLDPSHWQISDTLQAEVRSRLSSVDLDIGDLVAAFDDRLSASLAQVLERRELAKVFDANFEGFSHPKLAERFRQYRSSGGRANAVRWAMNQTNGQYRDILIDLLGDNFSRRLRSSLSNKLVPQVTDEARAFIHTLLESPAAGSGIIQPYRDLIADRRGWGYLFEADHMLEKRFLSSPRVDGNIADPDDLFAILVPKNRTVSRQLTDLPLYDHQSKTQLMNILIPHGAEDLFTTQQWWDAHVFAFDALGLDASIYMPRLTEQFEDIARATGDTLNLDPTPKAMSHFFPENNWGSSMIPAATP